MKLRLITLFTAALTIHGQAAITFVDAVDTTNTFDTATGSVNTSWFETGTGANNSNDWRSRSTFGNGGTIYEGGYTTDDPELTTELSGLSVGTYDVWVFFWDSSGGSNAWNIAAGLTSGSLTTYSFDGLGDTTSEVDAGTLSFTASVVTSEGDRTLYGVNIGQAAVDGTGILDVFVDNGGASPDDRTWYDGVGYELVPEPSAALLGGLGALLLLRRRRN